jgi:hypothetical protein
MTTCSISLMHTGLFRFSFLSCVNFGKLHFSRNLSILLSCQIGWHKIAHKTDLLFFLISAISGVVIHFPFLILVISVLLFFLD